MQPCSIKQFVGGEQNSHRCRVSEAVLYERPQTKQDDPTSDVHRDISMVTCSIATGTLHMVHQASVAAACSFTSVPGHHQSKASTSESVGAVVSVDCTCVSQASHAPHYVWEIT